MTAPEIKPLDFLPDKYRQATKRRRTKYWRGIVVVLFLGVFAACAGSLAMVDREVRRELDQVNARFAAAKTQDLLLKQKEAKHAEISEYADLLTFLRHPWPRSRIVSELFYDLPMHVTFDKLHMAYETRQGVPPVVAVATTEATVRTAANDLTDLRAALEVQDFIVRLEGTTGDQPGLHAYLQSLVGRGLFVDAEIEQIEAVRTAGVSAAKFTARIIVRPGWGLSGGPLLEELAPPPNGDEPRVAVLHSTALPSEVRP